ncbi:HEAT repeat-containing protein 1 [Plodia interpunctella]|uniref:HEAT repeat-containing protein 1 n=1 Tax=Plodia interpunctella TaxID=58824 RepID=UPI0023684669|nr:HEAT repeat-containing protein 1 [Plodia interpunctella]XP_053600517.1 HEAT repeat-containing protein 1 [Plodia interpunctella]
MAATSLAEQLQRLAVPQSTIYKDDKKRASLLFDPKEAALKDRDTFYEIGKSGLQELIALYEGFRFYEDTLFSQLSKDFERAIETKEVNQNLDQTIEKFLLELSPFFLLQSAHKALEWLVNRYQIHQYNQDAIMALILPYHSSKIFIRFVQIMDIKSNKWSWLMPIQKEGVPLANQVWYNQCVSNITSLKFVADATVKYVNEFGERASQLNTVFTFFCQTSIGVINAHKQISEPLLTALFPTVMKAIVSPIVDFRASAYMILGFLFTKASIKRETLDEIIAKLLSTEFTITYDIVMLITMMYAHQTHMKKLSRAILFDISVDVMSELCGHLKKSVENKQNILPFTLAFLSSVLSAVQNDNEDFRRLSELPIIFIEEVDLRNQHPEKVIRCVLNAYRQNSKKAKSDDESDLEIIEEDTSFSMKILEWYSLLLKNLETKYPEAFDKVIKEILSSDSKVPLSKRKSLSQVLGFKPAVAHKIGDNYLFEHLNHINPNIRIEAVKYIGISFISLKKENAEFVKDSIVNRLNDDNPAVVDAILDLPNEYLEEVLTERELANAFVNIVVSKTSKDWVLVVMKLMLKFCSLPMLPVNQDTVLTVLPHLFPHDEVTAEITWQIVNSPWGKKFDLTKNLKGLNESHRDNADVLKHLVYKALFDEANNFDNILDDIQLNKSNTLDVYMFLLLKTCSLKWATAEEIIKILSILLESVENRAIIASTEDKSFSVKNVTEFIDFGKHDKVLFEVVEYIFTKIIEDMTVQGITKPWCDICAIPGTILVRRLYEIFITGCGIPTYDKKYVNLLKSLLSKFCDNSKEKFEFLANFACGHILYAKDPKDVIGPQLQLKTIKLLYNFCGAQVDETWLYESDSLILMILFNLNNPMAPIREAVFDIMNYILRDEPENETVYLKLVKELMSHKEELLLDHEQIIQVLQTVLTQQTPVKKIFRKNCLIKFTNILTGDSPAHIKSNFLKLLSKLDNANVFPHIVPCLDGLEKVKTRTSIDISKFKYNIYESSVLRSIYSHINESTVSTFSKDEIWNYISAGLKDYGESILEENHQTYTSSCVLIMKRITEDVFKKVPDKRTKELIYLMTSAGAFSSNPSISSVAAKAMKNIHLKFVDFKPILEGMLKVEDPADKTSKKKSVLTMLSYQVTETKEWKLGVTLLEYVQSKKKMTVDNSFVQILFQIFNKCLNFEEQSYVEYTKQLLLSSVWYYCRKFVDDNNKEQVKKLKSLFNVELIVKCIRGTQNPQTHHHALILLSHASYMLPEAVLHHMMEIFTFMGSSVLRHDDAYSFQIIVKIIETLIPILVKLDKSIDEYTDRELQQLQTRVVPVLRIFADVVLHVPEHRRLPLYKKLIETLGPNHFLWIFLGLLLETHIAHMDDNKKHEKSKNRNLADREAPMNRLDFGQNILLEFSPEVCLYNFNKLLVYLKSLPLQKDENSMDTDIDQSDIFSVNGHTALQLRLYKYVIITFMNSFLASSRFIEHTNHATDDKLMESHYRGLIVNILTFIQSISKLGDEKTAKYWRVMLHHSYDLLDHTNNLLSAPMFLSVIRGLLKHNLQTVRRKSMELLNSKIQFSPEMFAHVDKQLMYSLLPVLMDIIKTIQCKDETLIDVSDQELELNQQTALLSLKLMTRFLASKNPEPFKPVLEIVTDYTCNPNISPNVMASIVLCLAELCGNLKAHALASMRKFMPALIKVLKKQRKAETPELVLLSTVTAITKIVESLPLFLSPYLQKILYEYAILLAKWQTQDQECSKVSGLLAKLTTIKKRIAASIPPRVLIPVANETHRLLLEKENYEAIGPVMSVLADSFANVTTADFTALQQDLTAFFLSALQLRSDAVDKTVDDDVIDKAEDEVVNALVRLVLKLSETSFRPFYFKIYDWAIRTNVEAKKDRAITFYRLSCAIADQLKGLFVLFAGHFIKNASELLDSCNNSKTEDLYFDSDKKCIVLVKYIIKTLHTVFLYDSQNFLNKERFETLMQPVVDQLENTVGGVLSLKTRAAEYLIPCISQFAVATGDDSLWKLLNYQVLLKTRHNDAEIRLTALDCLVSMATQLGSSWLPLLAESVPFLAELLEDGDARIEAATKDAVRTLEVVLGEPLEKYF